MSNLVIANDGYKFNFSQIPVFLGQSCHYCDGLNKKKSYKVPYGFIELVSHIDKHEFRICSDCLSYISEHGYLKFKFSYSMGLL